MPEVGGLIALLIFIIVIGVVAWIVIYCIDLLPVPAPFAQVAKVLVLLIAVLSVLYRALPLLGVAA